MKLTIALLIVVLCLASRSSGAFLTKCQVKALIEDSGLWYGDDIRKLTCISWYTSRYQTDYMFNAASGDVRYGLFGISGGRIMNPPSAPSSQRWCFVSNPSGMCQTDCMNLLSEDGFFSSNCALTIYQAWNNTFNGWPAYIANKNVCDNSFSIATCP